MKIGDVLPYRRRRSRDAARHAEAIAGILETPPIVPRNDGLVLFSMIGTVALLPYLVAVKSLWSQLRRGRVAIMDDGTLTAQDRAILAHHCGDPEFIHAAGVETSPFPQGNSWERFLTILDRRQSEYWLQLDSDTVTLGPVPEVEAAIARNRSFLLLGCIGAEIGPLPLSDFVRTFYPDGSPDDHVQKRVESRLDSIGEGPDWKYVRGCSGFTGFSAYGGGRPLAAAFLAAMTKIIGAEDLDSWGTEQIASNFQLANEPAVTCLPYSRYLNYWAEPWSEEAAFIHFVGTHRHHGNAYIEASRAAIARLVGTG
jgi:hypothetical protein